MKYGPDDLEAMAQTAWGEARGEGLGGMHGVLWVIRNRAEDGRWPNSPHNVVHQPYQFTAWNSDNPNREKMLNVTRADPLYEAAVGMARAILEDQDAHDPTGGANHYFATHIERPDWAKDMTFTAKMGNHKFYKN